MGSADAGHLCWGNGLAVHLACRATIAFGFAKSLAGVSSVFTDVDSVNRTGPFTLQKHDLGGIDIDDLLYDRGHGSLEQPATEAARIGAGPIDNFLPVCFQTAQPG